MGGSGGLPMHRLSRFSRIQENSSGCKVCDRPSGSEHGDHKMDPETALQEATRYFGPTLKPKQDEAVLRFTEGNDIFSLPTGYRKSLIYGILPVVFDLMKGKAL